MNEWRRLAELEERAARLYRRLERIEQSAPPGRFALVMEVDDLEFLVDPGLLWGPPRVAVRRGLRVAEIWLHPDGPALSSLGRFTELEERRLLALVSEHLEDLTDAWFNLRQDRRRGRLHRHLFVD